MISKNMTERLSEQLNKEIYSGYFYLGMSTYAASIGLKGFANWFFAQWKEELFHAKKLFDYINEQGEKVIIKAIDEPPQDFSSGKELFEKTLAHEKKVTGLIKDLASLAEKENDKASQDLLAWFVKEQIEEEETPAGILKRIKDAEKSGKDLTGVDKELATRKAPK